MSRFKNLRVHFKLTQLQFVGGVTNHGSASAGVSTERNQKRPFEMHVNLHGLFSMAVYLCFHANLFAQQATVDSNFIKPFYKQNALEVYPGIYSTRFNFTNRGQQKNDYRLAVNSSGYLGAYVNYKWLSLKYVVNMPGTQLDKDVKFKYTSLRFRFGNRQMLFHPFFDSYNGLLIPEAQRHRYQPFRNIRFADAGFDYYYFTNTKYCSFRAGNFFSEKQVKPAGAFFLMATPMWQQINWINPTRNLIRDSATYTLLSSDPQWVSMVTGVGYFYNFVFSKGRWIVSPALLIGAGGLREINTINKKIRGVSNIQAWLNAGYNGPNYYCYLNASWNNLQTNLFIKNMHQIDSDISFTCGFRFNNRRKKILGIL